MAAATGVGWGGRCRITMTTRLASTSTRVRDNTATRPGLQPYRVLPHSPVGFLDRGLFAVIGPSRTFEERANLRFYRPFVKPTVVNRSTLGHKQQ
ncbi:hypothetical protein J6590_071978 [Homalodisca vitripennis]|nr:hypothetical protein J6590_091382 [Homalodisca vitripennis]KAG8310006.1 hypothetical protein J6590_071978 [Homalodisca vitripennis]